MDKPDEFENLPLIHNLIILHSTIQIPLLLHNHEQIHYINLKIYILF